MIREEIAAIDTGNREIRKFGISIGVVLTVIGGAALYFGRDWFAAVWTVAAVLLVFSLLTPTLVRPVYKAWMVFSVLLGWLVTRIILSLLYYVVFTAIGIIGKISGKAFLDLGFKTDTGSYWTPREHPATEKSDYERQF